MKRFIFLLILSGLPCCMYAQKVFTLSECRALAVQNNKELQISGEKIKVANQERNAAVTKYFPQISARGLYLRNEKNLQLFDVDALGAKIPPELIGDLMNILPDKYKPYLMALPDELKKAAELDIKNLWVGNLSLVQPVYAGGKIASYNQITNYAGQLAETQNDTKLQEVIYLTDETYWQVISLVNKKKLAASYVSLLQSMDGDVQKMIAEGVATRADGLSVKVKLNEAEVMLNKVENGVSLSRMLLAQLCGIPLEEEIQLADETLERLPVGSQSPLPVHKEDAWANRSELKSLDYVIRIYKKKETIALSDALPNVAFTANYLGTTLLHPNEFSGMWNAGVIVQVPLSGWAESTFKRNAARAETVIRQLEKEEVKEKIELQVNQSVYKVNEANKKLTAATRNLEHAEENLRYARLGFEEGVIPSLNLLEAQTAWVSASTELIDAQIEIKLTEVYLSKAMGNLTVSD
jgi:outer membrane protein TolC